MFQLREVMVSDKAKSGLVGKRENDRGDTMDPEDFLRKRKRQEESHHPDDHQELHLSRDDHLLKQLKPHNPTASLFDPNKRRTFKEDSPKCTLRPDYYKTHMSLDLELNLSSSFIDPNHHHDHNHINHINDEDANDHHEKKKNTTLGSNPELTRNDHSWLRLDNDGGGGNNDGDGGGRGRDGGVEEEEMVARVCMKCHMLVMLCKTSPSCPNCKFMHSPQQSSHFNFLLFTPKPPLLSLINYLTN